jgi:hypothetical protein
MEFVSTYSGEYATEGIVNGYDWSKLGKALLVDLGGAHGIKGSSIIRANPNLTCVVQDLPKTIEE